MLGNIKKIVFQKIIDQKVQNRTLEKKLETNNYLIFTEHNPVYTIGKSGDNVKSSFK